MLLEIFQKIVIEPQQAVLPVVMGVLSVGMQVYQGINASNKANAAKTEADKLKDQIGDLENARQEVYNASEDIRGLAGQITNPYENLGVATQAAEMQAEQTDIALANTLDAMQAGGMGAGGATALAQAAARSKQGISASIETQEAQNEKLRAQGEVSVQNQKLQLEQSAIRADQQAWQAQETRELAQLDRAQAQYDNQLAQQYQYQADAMGAFTGAASSAMSMGMGASEGSGAGGGSSSSAPVSSSSGYNPSSYSSGFTSPSSLGSSSQLLGNNP